MSTDSMLVTPKMKLQSLLDSLLHQNESKIRTFQTTQTSFKKGNTSRLMTSISPAKKPHSQRAVSRQNIKPPHSAIMRYVISSRVSKAEMPEDVSIQLDDDASLFTEIERRLCKECLKKTTVITELEQQNKWLKSELTRNPRERTPSNWTDMTSKLKDELKITNMQRDLRNQQHVQIVAQLRKQHEAELTTQRLQLTESLRKVETLETELRKYDTIAEEVSQLESSIRQVQKESSGHQLRLQEQYQQVEFLYSLDQQISERQQTLQVQLGEFFETLSTVLRIFRGEQPIYEVLNQRKPMSQKGIEGTNSQITRLIQSASSRIEFFVELHIKVGEASKLLREIQREYKSTYFKNLIY